MDNVLSRSTTLTFGHSNQKDAFQRGREAAQMAKAQQPSSNLDLILALGPASSHFQDFIEGVRLVTGEKGLIGFPSHHVFTNDLYLEEGGLVVLVQSDTLHFSLASADLQGNAHNAAFSSLNSQYRHQRGNIFHQYEFRGTLIIDNSSPSDNSRMIAHASVESGLDSWVVGITPPLQPALPILCNDQVVQKGLVGMECLSVSPVGIGTVTIEAFDRNPAIFREAVKSAIREAQSQMDSAPAAGFLFFDFPMGSKAVHDMQTLFRLEESPLRDCPLIGYTTRNHSVKYINRSGSVLKETVVALLLPL